MIRHRNTFTPRELFSRMQGAWFEPRIGSMWQENTGVTPTTSGGQTIGKLVDLSAARVASQATAANRPTLQYNGNLPLIRHDSTDVLVATMPAINVRRNLLTYSEQFDNAAWSKQSCTVTPNAAVDPNGNLTADLLTGTGGGGYYDKILYRSYTMALAGVTVTFSVYVYAGSATKASLFINKASGFERAVTVADLQPGWNRLSVSKTFVSDSSNGQLFVHICSGSVIDATGVGTIYPWGAQLEPGSTATDYQKITDWTSEAYSSSGSTYFATPQGMSCLHNQSIGTTYNLPAIQTDIYGTVITPARLAPPLEQRLALYMHRLAGLSDADFFWQEQATDGMTGQLLADDNDTILLRA